MAGEFLQLDQAIECGDVSDLQPGVECKPALAVRLQISPEAGGKEIAREAEPDDAPAIPAVTDQKELCAR